MKKIFLFLIIISIYACSGPVHRDVRVRPLTKKEAARLLSGARHHLGEPYKYGGESVEGWDCSGFTRTMFMTYLAYDMPRNTDSMYRQSVKVPESQKRPGDLVFFHIGSKAASHVGIFIGGYRFIHASESSGIIISDLREEYYQKSFMGFRRPLLAQAD